MSKKKSVIPLKNLVPDIEYLEIYDFNPEEAAELMTLIMHACNRHKPVEACAILTACLQKIMLDMSDAGNFKEFADHVIKEMTEAIGQIK